MIAGFVQIVEADRSGYVSGGFVQIVEADLQVRLFARRTHGA
jgi:hypothetical protein